ncbi:MAG: BMC domain-containing protein [Myxococcales bacterium]
MFTSPAIALLELESIARGYVLADAAVKKAAVRLLLTEAVTPGKFLLLFDGSEADVEESYREAVALAGPGLLDKLHLPHAHPQLAEALVTPRFQSGIESLGILETQTAASALLAADAAVKSADVRLSWLRLARGIGGKGYFLVSGSLDMVEAAVASAAQAIAPELLMTTEVIARPHADLVRRLHA